MADFMHKRLISVSKPQPIPEGATLVFANGTFHNGCKSYRPYVTEISGGILRFKSLVSSGPTDTYIFGIDQTTGGGTGKDSNVWCLDVAVPLYPTEYLTVDFNAETSGTVFAITDKPYERKLYRYDVGQFGKNSLHSHIRMNNRTYPPIPANITVLGVYSIYFE